MSVARPSKRLIDEWEARLAQYGLSEKQLGLSHDHDSTPASGICPQCGQPIEADSDSPVCEDCARLAPCDAVKPLGTRLADGYEMLSPE